MDNLWTKALQFKKNEEWMIYLAGKIRAERHRLNLTQQQAALKAGIPLRTYKRFEQSCNGNFKNFIKVLSAFDKLNILQAIFVEVNTTTKPNLEERIQVTRKKSLSRD